jgi:hypothetical protein
MLCQKERLSYYEGQDNENAKEGMIMPTVSDNEKVIVIKASDPKEIQKMVEELAKIKCRKSGTVTISGGGTVSK